MSEMMKDKKNISRSILVVFGLVLISVLLFPQLFMEAQPQDLEISIIATGEKSEQSWGNDVRIGRILVDYQKP